MYLFLDDVGHRGEMGFWDDAGDRTISWRLLTWYCKCSGGGGGRRVDDNISGSMTVFSLAGWADLTVGGKNAKFPAQRTCSATVHILDPLALY